MGWNCKIECRSKGVGILNGVEPEQDSVTRN